MSGRDDRKARIVELSKHVKEANKTKNNVLFKECLDSLGNDIKVLTEIEGKHIYGEFQRLFPITSWGRIDWNIVKNKMQVNSISELIDLFKSEYRLSNRSCFILWDSGDNPVIHTDVFKVLNVIDEINAVSFDQWFLSVEGMYVIEFYHEGEITIGFLD